MQLFLCPFCGERSETEFRFVGELGKLRPDTTAPISDEDWSRYLYTQRNEKGAVREVWMHLPCAELFILDRDSVTMQVTGSRALRGAAE
ncbi:MAG: sarcosine oxidase subunit delta [Pseudomonadota bacterium]